MMKRSWDTREKRKGRGSGTGKRRGYNNPALYQLIFIANASGAFQPYLVRDICAYQVNNHKGHGVS